MLAYLFVIFAVLARMPFMPHPWNLAPVAAALLYFGARGPRRQLWVPFALLAASDIILTKFVYAFPFSWDHFVTWAWYAAILWLGTGLREKSGAVRVIGAALASSVSFFLISNFAVWAAWQMYPKNFSGLMMSYAAGLPFFRGTVESDVFFSVAFFGVPVFLHALSGRMHKSAGDHAAAA